MWKIVSFGHNGKEALIKDILAAVDDAKRQAAESHALAAMEPSSLPSGPVRSRRYDEDFWGASGNAALSHLRKALGASKPDDAAEDPQLELDAVWDLEKCKQSYKSQNFHPKNVSKVLLILSLCMVQICSS